MQSSARASRFARVPLQRRYGGSGAYAPLKRLSCVVSLAYACCRCDGSGFRVITHDFACVGVGRVVSFASLRVVSSRSSVSLLCVHVRGRVDARLRVFYVFAILGFVGIFGIFAHACLQ